MKSAIALLAKAPEPGRVKTRLQPELTPEAAAAVYEACLHDVVANVAGVAAEPHVFYDDTRGAADYFGTEFPGIASSPQVPGDLGARMTAVSDQMFRAGFDLLLIVGADSPTLPTSCLTKAFDLLSRTDVVFGPTLDGGYYLVGLSRTCWPAARTLFQDIPWSTHRVLDRSLARARQAGVRYGLVRMWYDIDQIEDLRRAAQDADPESELGRWLKAAGESLLRGEPPHG